MIELDVEHQFWIRDVETIGNRLVLTCDALPTMERHQIVIRSESVEKRFTDVVGTGYPVGKIFNGTVGRCRWSNELIFTEIF